MRVGDLRGPSALGGGGGALGARALIIDSPTQKLCIVTHRLIF